MSAILRITLGNQIVSQFFLEFNDLNKANVQQLLKEKFFLQSDYRITYTDADGDQIMVEFDQDYDVAKMTFEEKFLVLNVQPEDQKWYSQFEDKKNLKDKSQNFFIDQNAQINSSSKQIKEKNLEIAEIQIKTQSLNNQNGLQKFFQQSTEILERKEKNYNKYVEFIEQIQKINNTDLLTLQISKEQEKQKQPKKQINKLLKRTETQSQDQCSNQQLKKKQKSIRQNEKTGKLEQRQNQKPQDWQEKTENEVKPIQSKRILKKCQKKQKKQKRPKSQKKKKFMTEIQVKKLIKQEIFKMLPQISQKLANNSKESSSEYLLNQKLDQMEIGQCSQCSSQLSVPFYINSSLSIKLCQKCQMQNKQSFPLVKIRDQKVGKSIVWAEPVYQTNQTIIFKQSKNPIKFYNQVKSSLVSNIKQKFQKKVKEIKQSKKKNEQKKIPSKQVILSQSSD